MAIRDHILQINVLPVTFYVTSENSVYDGNEQRQTKERFLCISVIYFFISGLFCNNRELV